MRLCEISVCAYCNFSAKCRFAFALIAIFQNRPNLNYWSFSALKLNGVSKTSDLDRKDISDELVFIYPPSQPDMIHFVTHIRADQGTLRRRFGLVYIERVWIYIWAVDGVLK